MKKNIKKYFLLLIFIILLINSTLANTNYSLQQTNNLPITDQATPTSVLKEVAKTNYENISTNIIKELPLKRSIIITPFDIENSMKRALFDDNQLNYISITYDETNTIYLYQWKNLFSYHINLPTTMTYSDYLGLKFNIQDFIRTLSINYDVSLLKTVYVKEFLTLSLASALLEMRHYIIDKYEINPIYLTKLIREIKTVNEICKKLDQDPNVDWHTKFNDYVLNMLMNVVRYYEKEKNIFYPGFKIWETSIEEIEKFHQDLIKVNRINTNTN